MTTQEAVGIIERNYSCLEYSLIMGAFFRGVFTDDELFDLQRQTAFRRNK